MWILEKMPRTATLTNADGLTPLHMIAWTGLPTIAEETRAAALERMAHALVEKKADLLQTVSRLQHRKDKFAQDYRSKTPLEIAVQQKSSRPGGKQPLFLGPRFPKQMLHLLTLLARRLSFRELRQSYHFPTKSRLFIEVNIIAKATP